MLEAAIERVSQRLPDVELTVLTRSVSGLHAIAPEARVVSVENRAEWQWIRSSYIAVRKAMPNVDPFIRSNFPELFSRLLRLKAKRLVNVEALAKTDFLLLSGGGYFTDVFAGQAWSSIERIRAADSRRIPFAVVGHGIGPLTSRKLTDAVRGTLEKAKLIALREGLRSLPILESLNIDLSRVIVTGDDSIEHAWNARKEHLGNALGVNLRVAAYAGTTGKDVSALHDALEPVVDFLGADIIGVPVCVVRSVESESDADVASRIVSSFANGRDDPAPRTLADLIERTSRCRIVVTGSYHGAVFALSQGITAVCIHHSEYYRAKFEGLANQFGSGCNVLDGKNPNFAEALRDSVLESWSDAELFRPKLIAAATRQVAAGCRAYDRLAGIIAESCGTEPTRIPELVA
jgi:polysaccharide pyruvyl transferase WcaK-like protein